MNVDRQRWVGILVLGLAIVSLIWSTVTGVQSFQYARCQAGVNEALVQTSVARAAAAEQDRDSDRDESAATAELIRTVFEVQTPAERIAAYTAYRKALDEINARRAEAEAQRTQNPLPAPPSAICG